VAGYKNCWSGDQQWQDIRHRFTDLVDQICESLAIVGRPTNNSGRLQNFWSGDQQWQDIRHRFTDLVDQICESLAIVGRPTNNNGRL
jgi:uncharacterized protein YutD